MCRWQPGCQRRASIPNPIGTDQPEGQVLGQPLGIVPILVPSQATVRQLPQQIRKGQPRIVCSGVRQVPFDKFAASQPFVQFSNQNQTSVRGYP